jgi:hypothetical protein
MIFEKNVFEQQSPAPGATQKPVHEKSRLFMVRIPFVIKADEKTGIEDDHGRRSP